MSAPPKPWESNGGLSRRYGDFSGQPSSNVMSNGGLYSSLPLHPTESSRLIPQGVSLPVLRRPHNSTTPPMPPPPRVVSFRQNQAYPPSTVGGYGYGLGGLDGASTYGGLGSYGAGSYGGLGARGYGGYGGSYGGYGASSYGGYGASSYGGYGGFGSTIGQRTYGGYGGANNYPMANPMNVESRFIQMAEAGSRPAFESIESVVQTFGSVSFMLESTMQALYSSFRAVLGVAENVGRLRTLFGQVFSLFAVLRALQWLYRKMLYYLGLRSDNPGREAIWQQAGAAGGEAAAAAAAAPTGGRSFWPLAVFLGMVCSGPYLVYRLLASLGVTPQTVGANASSEHTLDAWKASGEPIYVGRARYDFMARVESEVGLKGGEKLLVAPKPFQTYGREWLMVSVGGRPGLVPTNYVRIYGTEEAVAAAGVANHAAKRATALHAESQSAVPYLSPPAAAAAAAAAAAGYPSPVLLHPVEMEPRPSGNASVPGLSLDSIPGPTLASIPESILGSGSIPGLPLDSIPGPTLASIPESILSSGSIPGLSLDSIPGPTIASIPESILGSTVPDIAAGSPPPDKEKLPPA